MQTTIDRLLAFSSRITMSTPPVNPEAAIIGAGIAGLSAAIALRRAGWRCTVYERSSLKNEVGAAIIISPTATRCLDKWGFDYDKAQPTENTVIITSKGDDMAVLSTEVYDDCETVHGAKCWSFHRGDLHRGLMDLAMREEGEGIPATAKLECTVVDVDCMDGLVRLADGTKVKKDLVIIADGVHVSLEQKR
jgi:salicylate hydroxylase